MLSLKIPSTTYNGCTCPRLTVPLMRISGAAPGVPLLTTERPATLLCREDTGLVLGLSDTSRPDIFVIDPVRSLLLAVPYPITTTSSMTLLDACNEIFRLVLP